MLGPREFVGWEGHGDIPVPSLHTFMQLLLSQEPKNSLKNPRTLSRAQTLPHLSTDGTCWSWAIIPKSLSSPWKDLTNTICLSCCRYCDGDWVCWASLGYQGVTEQLQLFGLQLSPFPNLLKLFFRFFGLLLGGFTLKNPPLKISSHFLHSIEQLLVICLTSGDCQRFFSFRLF